MTPFLLALALAAVSGSGKAADEQTLYDFTLPNIDGKEVRLSEYKGKVVVVVNVASRCGLTPQYEALQKLYDQHREQGLVVLGFPANDFRGQEPGSNEEIKFFCTENYGVTFPMFAKLSVIGDEAHPLFRWLVASSDRRDEPIEWNFAKFIVGRDGRLVKRVRPQVKPDSEEFLTAVRAALAAR